MIKKFEQFNENIKYNLDKDDYINVDEQKHITELYVTQIEKASQSKVIEINGSVSESDCELYFTLSDDIEIIVEYIFNKEIVVDIAKEYFLKSDYGKSPKYCYFIKNGIIPKLPSKDDFYKKCFLSGLWLQSIDFMDAFFFVFFILGLDR